MEYALPRIYEGAAEDVLGSLSARGVQADWQSLHKVLDPVRKRDAAMGDCISGIAVGMGRFSLSELVDNLKEYWLPLFMLSQQEDTQKLVETGRDVRENFRELMKSDEVKTLTAYVNDYYWENRPEIETLLQALYTTLGIDEQNISSKAAAIGVTGVYLLMQRAKEFEREPFRALFTLEVGDESPLSYRAESEMTKGLQRIVLGRDTGPVPLHSPNVSRKHFEFVKKDGQVQVRKIGSSRWPTLLNGEKLKNQLKPAEGYGEVIIGMSYNGPHYKIEYVLQTRTKSK